jgi:hypothetical protein
MTLEVMVVACQGPPLLPLIVTARFVMDALRPAVIFIE